MDPNDFINNFSTLIRNSGTFLVPETLVLSFLVPFSGLFLATIGFFVGALGGSFGLYYYYLFNLVWMFSYLFINGRLENYLDGIENVEFISGLWEYSKNFLFGLSGFVAVCGVAGLATNTFISNIKPRSIEIAWLFAFTVIWGVLSYFKFKK